jgi:hypothetical protein
MELWLGQVCGKDMKVWQLEQIPVEFTYNLRA